MAKENNNTVKNAIKAYLDKRAAEDEQFAVSYAKPNKSIDECFRYIIGEVHNKGNAVYLSDAEVFGMAVHYYDEDDIKIKKLPNGTQVSSGSSSTDVKLTKAEKDKIKETKVCKTCKRFRPHTNTDDGPLWWVEPAAHDNKCPNHYNNNKQS